jgi:hypothetical protein
MSAEGGHSFLGMGKPAPPPSGPPDDELRRRMLAQLNSWFFQLCITCWAKVTFRKPFDWESYTGQLGRAEYLSYRTVRQALRSFGWAGLTPDGRWKFGVLWYRVWVYGPQAMRHELFHASQDQCYNLFSRERTLLGSLAAEYAAHFWGGPLIGIPIVYGGTMFIVSVLSLVVAAVLAPDLLSSNWW